MGAEVLGLFNVFLCVPPLNMVLHERVNVHLEDNVVYPSLLCHYRCANILEIKRENVKKQLIMCFII